VKIVKLLEQEELYLIDESMKSRIFDMAKKGMTILAIATALSLPMATVQNVIAKEPATQEQQVNNLAIGDIAKTIYHEAGNQNYQGKLAVASVIMNRAKQIPAKIQEVIHKPKQFSCWNGKSQLPEGKGNNWEDSIKIAKQMMSGEFKPITTANHYYNPDLCSPSWAKGQQFTAIGDHNFLRL